METEELIIKATNRVADVAMTKDSDPVKLLETIGITDGDFYREWLEGQAEELIEMGVLRNLFVHGEPGVFLVDSMAVAMMQGMLIGYQMAVLREDEE